VEISSLEANTALIRELLPFLKEQNSKWEGIEASDIKTTNALIHRFWSHLRNKLNDKRRLSKDVVEYKRKLETESEEETAYKQNEHSVEPAEINPAPFEPSPEKE